MGLGLGRRPAPDERDTRFLMAAALPPADEVVLRTSRYWYAQGWWGDQGDTSECVGYSWAHWLEDGPVSHIGPAPLVAPRAIYTEAQRVDEWDGEGYEGTSVRAGAKALVARGWISEYRWAFDIDTLVRAVLLEGPVVMGTNWYRSMFTPTAEGFVDIAGPIDGGHAWLVDGVNLRRNLVRCKNSWGRSWGKRGFFYMSLDTLARLLHEEGEACIGREVGNPRPT